jgi:hypothetical protein
MGRMKLGRERKETGKNLGEFWNVSVETGNGPDDGADRLPQAGLALPDVKNHGSNRTVKIREVQIGPEEDYRRVPRWQEHR